MRIVDGKHERMLTWLEKHSTKGPAMNMDRPSPRLRPNSQPQDDYGTSLGTHFIDTEIRSSWLSGKPVGAVAVAVKQKSLRGMSVGGVSGPEDAEGAD